MTEALHCILVSKHAMPAHAGNWFIRMPDVQDIGPYLEAPRACGAYPSHCGNVNVSLSCARAKCPSLTCPGRGKDEGPTRMYGGLSV